MIKINLVLRSNNIKKIYLNCIILFVQAFEFRFKNFFKFYDYFLLKERSRIEFSNKLFNELKEEFGILINFEIFFFVFKQTDFFFKILKFNQLIIIYPIKLT